MITALIIAYILTGTIKVSEVIRRNEYVFAIYKELTLLQFIITYTIAVLLWFPTMIRLTYITMNKEK
jgi:hypothetical protein